MKIQDGPTPLVVGDMGWADTIPDWLRAEIEAERMVYGLAGIMGKEVPLIGDAELCAYLMTAALRAPLTHEYTEIYIYLTAKLTQKREGVKLDPDFQEKLDRGLTEWEQQELEQLKSDIYRKRGGEVRNPLLDTMRDFKKAIDNIPKGMEGQETLTGTPMQIHFQHNEPKKKGKSLNPNRAKKREKKGSNNLATFGVQDPELPSIQDCLDMVEKGKENRKRCCKRLIEKKALEENAWENGEFDKVCSDCAGCGEGVPE